MIYPKWFYYFAIVWNLFDRFLWMVVWVADTKEFPFLGSPFSYVTLQLFSGFQRRWNWFMIRMENEQLSNPEGYR